MQIHGLPKFLNSLLDENQLNAIHERIPSPVVAITSADPDWDRIDRLLTAENNVMDRSRSGHIIFSIHEILPRVSVAWLVDDSHYYDIDQTNQFAILLNADDLKVLREDDLSGLAIRHLLKDF